MDANLVIYIMQETPLSVIKQFAYLLFIKGPDEIKWYCQAKFSFQNQLKKEPLTFGS